MPAKLKGKNRERAWKRLTSPDGKLYCHYCKREVLRHQPGEAEATLDHIIPKCRGGGNTAENLVVACYYCNQKKNCQYQHPLREISPKYDTLQRAFKLYRGFSDLLALSASPRKA